MTYFKYKRIAPNGEMVSGISTFPYKDPLSVISRLESDGSTILSVKKLGRLATLRAKVAGFTLRKTATRAVQAELLYNVAMMLRAGMPLVSALKEAVDDAEKPALARDVNEMMATIQGGTPFSEAAARYPKLFPKTVVHLIRIGEETGRLDQMLARSADHLKKVQRIVSDTQRALLYPLFVFIALAGGLIFWLYFVVPKIVVLFRDLKVELPAITRVILNTSDFVSTHIGLLTGGLLLLILLVLTAYKRFSWSRRMIDTVLLKLPVVGKIISASVMAFITEYFAILINAGIDILQSLSILADASRNALYSEKIREVRQRLRRGESIAVSFEAAAVFPRFVTRMINIGELSGNLSEQLDYIANEYRERLSIVVDTIGKSLEPLILMFAGAVFIVIIIGLFLPVYDLVSQVSR